MNNTGIREQVIEEIRILAEKYQIEKIYLFGSRARGEYHRTSEIDVAVSGGEFDRFALDIDEDTSTLLKFDIVDLNRMVHPELLDAIQKEGRVLYEKV